MTGTPDLESSLAELTHAIGLVLRRLRAATATQDLAWGDRAVLGRLARGGPATTAELARAEVVTPQSMGATLAALEAKGLVERRPHPTDGRRILIQLTAKGAATRQQLQAAKHSWLAKRVGELDPQDQATLFAAGAILKRLAER